MENPHAISVFAFCCFRTDNIFSFHLFKMMMNFMLLLDPLSHYTYKEKWKSKKKKRNIRKYIFLSKHIVHWRLDWKHSENLWIFYINRSRKYKTWITLNLIEAYKYIFALKRNKKKHQNYKNEGMFVSQYKRIKNKTKTTTFEYKWIK